MFSSSGTFGDKKTRQELSGGFGGDSNPATQARLKREHQAQRAESRAREILEERRAAAAAGGGGGDARAGVGRLSNRFSTGDVARSFG